MGRQISSRLSLGFVSQKTNRTRMTELTIQGASAGAVPYAPWRASDERRWFGAPFYFGTPPCPTTAVSLLLNIGF
jgi:hypothetical protein